MTESKGRVAKGTVISTSMQGTIVVRLDRRVKHPLYKKIVTKSTKVHVDSRKFTEKVQLGDFVAIQECRPISKRKSWTLLKVLSLEAS